MDILAERITETTSRLTADPAAGETTPSVTAVLLNGHARLASGPFNWESDLGPAVGGENLAPSPTAYLLGALAACAVVFVRDTLAPQFGVTLADARATATCRTNTAGLLGIDGMSSALEAIQLDVELEATGPDGQVQAMLAAWRERCPIYLALVTQREVAVDFRVSPSAR